MNYFNTSAINILKTIFKICTMKKLRLATSAWRFSQEWKKDKESSATFFENISDAAKMVYAAFTGKYNGLKKRTLLKLFLGTLYVFLFIDFIPDFIPLIGWADDIAVLFWMYRMLKPEIEKFRAHKNQTSLA